MKNIQFVVFVFFLASALGFPLDQEGAENVEFPILKPADNEAEKTQLPSENGDQNPTSEDDHTEYPILKPNPDDFQVSRPYPIESNESGEPITEEEDKPVERPRPAVDTEEEDGSDLPSLTEFYPQGRLDASVLEFEELGNSQRNLKRSSSEDSEIDETDDTVVIDAASCEDLQKDCDASGGYDWITCETYKENCTGQGGENEDKEAAQIDSCIEGIAGESAGNTANCPSIVAKP